MKLPFSISFDLIAAEAQAVIDCGIEWDKGTPTLRVDDVLDSTGKASLLFDFEDEPLLTSIGYRIADAAESDERLLERAVERDVLEREAA